MPGRLWGLGDDLGLVALQRGVGVLPEQEGRQDHPVDPHLGERLHLVEGTRADRPVTPAGQHEIVGVVARLGGGGSGNVEQPGELGVVALAREEPIAQTTGPAGSGVGVPADVNRDGAAPGWGRITQSSKLVNSPWWVAWSSAHNARMAAT